ncbi:MAG: lysine biosynthesis protein LysW [Phycisphaerae bacterium]|jgi:alpha-aminoadipate carrier protein LysW
MSAPTVTACPCPECDAAVPFTRVPLRGEVVRCPDCTAELEVRQIDPLTLALAPQVEEDWGE